MRAIAAADKYMISSGDDENVKVFTLVQFKSLVQFTDAPNEAHAYESEASLTHWR